MESMSPDDVNAASLTHGRGLHMIRGAFDAVRFNGKGNQLLLVKYFTESFKRHGAVPRQLLLIEAFPAVGRSHRAILPEV